MRRSSLAGLALLLLSVAAAQAADPSKAVKVKKIPLRTKSAVMGVRGLDEEDLRTAASDPKAVESLERYVPATQELEAFARFQSRKLVAVAGGGRPVLDEAARKDEEEELRFGREISATLLGGAPLTLDQELQRYVNLVGTWVARGSDRPHLRWRFGILATDSVNAFAVPGGYVFVTMGLYRRLRSESELAGALGHEISHVVARDHYRMLALARTLQGAGAAARNVMAGMPGFKQIANLTLDHAAMVFSVALDRSAELEADRMGIVLAGDAGYEPFGLTRVLELLGTIPRDDSRTTLLFKTHPAPSVRLDAIEPLRRAARLVSKTEDPDMKERFDDHALVGRASATR